MAWRQALGRCQHDPVAFELIEHESRYKIDLGPRELRQCSAGQDGGSGGIRTPGASRHARFQVAGEPCAEVCPKLPTCGVSCDPYGSVWGTQQSVATWLLHADTARRHPCGVVPNRIR